MEKLFEAAVLRPEKLTREAFASFGDVIEVNEATFQGVFNRDTAEVFADVATADVNAKDGHPSLDIFRCTPLDTPISIRMMERHPLSSQAFIPMGNSHHHPYLVVVSPAGEFDITKIRAFIARSNQGVNYHVGTWHHFCLALNESTDFLVIGRKGDGENEEIISLDEGQHFSIDLSL